MLNAVIRQRHSLRFSLCEELHMGPPLPVHRIFCHIVVTATLGYIATFTWDHIFPTITFDKLLPLIPLCVCYSSVAILTSSLMLLRENVFGILVYPSSRSFQTCFKTNITALPFSLQEHDVFT
jgi:hypothetical protein